VIAVKCRAAAGAAWEGRARDVNAHDAQSRLLSRITVIARAPASSAVHQNRLVMSPAMSTAQCS
jgi:hypothetical protein